MSAPAIVFYHADCTDGFGAAYAAWRRLGASACYRGITHGELPALDKLAGREIVILDFAFERDQLTAMAGVARSVLQLDHHITARNQWAAELGKTVDGPQRWQHPERPLTVHFDMDKSGARLAWEHFHPDEPMPWPLRHVEDQDVWRFALPATRAFNRALRLLPFEFAVWDEVMREAATPDMPRYQTMVNQGETIERYYQGEVERLANGPLVMPVHMPGNAVGREHALKHRIPFIETAQGACRIVSGLAVNANSLFASELGNRLAEKCGSFALVWTLAADGEVKASLRAQGKVDVAKMAEHFGGGGHRNAAGFRMPAARFMAEILRQRA